MSYHRSHNVGRPYRRRSSPAALFILAVICIIGGPAVGFGGYAGLTDTKTLQANGQRVQGEVIGS